MTANAEERPLRFPRLLLEALVNGLRYRRLHQVDVADDVRREHVAKVIVKPTAAQALCNVTRYVISDVTSSRQRRLQLIADNNNSSSSPVNIIA